MDVLLQIGFVSSEYGGVKMEQSDDDEIDVDEFVA